MADDHRDTRTEIVEYTRRRLIDAALAAYEDAGLSGLCAEGRWEIAIDAMRSLDLTGCLDPG
jgi:hypothetical protein